MRPTKEYIEENIYGIIGGYADSVITGEIEDEDLPPGYHVIYYVEPMHNILKGGYPFTEYFERWDANERKSLEMFYKFLGLDEFEKLIIKLKEWLKNNDDESECEFIFEMESLIEDTFGDDGVEDLIEKFYQGNLHLFHPELINGIEES